MQQGWGSAQPGVLQGFAHRLHIACACSSTAPSRATSTTAWRVSKCNATCNMQTNVPAACRRGWPQRVGAPALVCTGCDVPLCLQGRGGPGFTATPGALWVVAGFAGQETNDVHRWDAAGRAHSRCSSPSSVPHIPEAQAMKAATSAPRRALHTFWPESPAHALWPSGSIWPQKPGTAPAAAAPQSSKATALLLHAPMLRRLSSCRHALCARWRHTPAPPARMRTTSSALAERWILPVSFPAA